MPRDSQQHDWRRLAEAVRARGVRPAQIRRTNDGYSIVTAEARLKVPRRTGSIAPDQWAEAVAERLLEVTGSARGGLFLSFLFAPRFRLMGIGLSRSCRV